MLWFLQVRGHGAADDSGEGCGRGVLAERSARHRPARPRHRVQFQPNLPPEPTSRQKEGAKGKHHD